MNRSIIIIGAGQAAAQAAISLRAGGFTGAITLIGDEAELPYQRPPLSKAFLVGDLAADRLYLRPESFYLQQQIKLNLGCRVTAIDRKAKQVVMAASEKPEETRLSYDIAIIATGGQPRRLACRGADLDHVFYLHDIGQARRLRDALKSARRMVIIGGGYIGLEVAAAARKKGLMTKILEAEPRLLSRVAAPEVSDFFAQMHRQQEVSIEAGMKVVECMGEEKISAIKCASGEVFPADIALVGIGLIPDMLLASKAGLETGNGICVNEEMRTSDPSIYAIGDCAAAQLPLYKAPVRLESVQNAIYQAKIAAAAICGQRAPQIEAPWFWSDQYNAKLQIAGLAHGASETILRGRIEDHSFVLFYLSGGRLLAADCVNRPQEFLLSRRVIAQKKEVMPSRLADDSLPPKEAFD